MVSFISILYEDLYLQLIICLHTGKCFQVLLFNTYNSIKHQLFVYTQLNDQTVPIQASQFDRSHLFAHSSNVKHFDSTQRSYQVLPLRAKGNLGAMAMKGYSAFHKFPAFLLPHNQIV